MTLTLDTKTLRSIKSIIFDFDGTLVNEEHWIKKRWELTLEFAESELDLVSFSDVFWRIFFEKGPKYRYHVNETLIKLGYSMEYVNPIVDKFIHEKVDEVLFGGVINCLDFLKDHYTLGILTNGKQEVQERRIENAGIYDYFSTIVCALENPKPDLDVYRKCLSLLDVSARDAVYVGNDCDVDFKAPNALGMISIYYNHKEKYEPCEIAHQITNFSELIQLLS